MRLSLSEISNPNVLDILKQSGTEIGDISGLIELELYDCVVELPIRHAIMHLIFWRNYHTFGIPIRSDHLVILNGICTKAIVSEFQSKAYKELIDSFPDREDDIIMRIWLTINEYNQFVLIELCEWHSSFDIYSLVQLMREPKVKKIIEVDITPEMGTDVVEKVISARNKELIALISTRGALENNILLSYMESSLLNVNQVQQMFISLGVRTDINDMIVLYPIQSSVMNGLKNILEYVVESLSAKKSLFYNHVAVKNSQYFSRKQHLLTSSIKNIYKGNCGSTLTIPFEVTARNHLNLVGKIIRLDDGTETYLTDANIASFIDTTINMYSPTTCRHQDGVCEHCGGLMMKYISQELDIGILCSILVLSQITQLILSSKHFVKTTSVIYKLPLEATPFLLKKNNEIYWKKDITKQFDDIELGVFIKDISPLNDVTLISVESDTTEERFSQISFMCIRKNGVDTPIPMMVDRCTPHFSMEMLLHMKHHVRDIKLDESMIWIPMKGFSGGPLFRTVVANDSMMDYVKNASAFLQVDIEKFTSIPMALKVFTDILYSKINTNILHAEVMLKAYLVTSRYNYDVPVVEDINNVLFQTNPRIIKNRTISGEFAFQCLLQYLSSPGTFLIPRSPGVFDPFFAI